MRFIKSAIIVLAYNYSISRAFCFWVGIPWENESLKIRRTIVGISLCYVWDPHIFHISTGGEIQLLLCVSSSIFIIFLCDRKCATGVREQILHWYGDLFVKKITVGLGNFSLYNTEAVTWELIKYINAWGIIWGKKKKFSFKPIPEFDKQGVLRRQKI